MLIFPRSDMTEGKPLGILVMIIWIMSIQGEGLPYTGGQYGLGPLNERK